MLWVLSKIGEYLGLVEGEPSLDYDTIAAILDEDDPLPQYDDEQPSDNKLPENPNGVVCEQRVGCVTELSDTFGYIKPVDDDNSRLYFDRKDDCPANLQVGSHVLFLGYKLSEDSEWIVRKILSLENETWDRKDNCEEEEVPLNQTAVKVQCETAYKHVIVKVKGRQGRTVLADLLEFSLDSVQVDFIPIEGDWVVLESLVQTEQTADTVLQVDRVKAVRSRHCRGKVTHWNSQILHGIIDGEVFFSKDCCQPGYHPQTGDKVWIKCIESEQGLLMWRAVHVEPLVTNNQCPKDYKAMTPLLLNKQGIVVSENTSCGTLHIGEHEDIQIEVKNEGDTKQDLISVELQAAESQIQIVGQVVDKPITINPQDFVTFTLRVYARFVGRSTEMVIFRFDGFEIGRQVALDVGTESWMVERAKRAQKFKQETVTSQNLLATRNGFIIAGVRPLQPAKFIPVQLGMFVIPEHLITTVLDTGTSRKEEVLARLARLYNYLTEPLTAKTYISRWDTLIHLEEIEHRVSISRYNTSKALYRVHEYISLEIQGLAERRPSLLVGDRIIARKDDSFTTGSDGDAYEGYVHKTLSNEVLLKFHPKFHDRCYGVYSLTFEANRTSFRRCHQAVHVALRNLSEDWFFPSCVNYKPPQMVIIGEENYVDLVREQEEESDSDADSVNNKNPSRVQREDLHNETNSIKCAYPARVQKKKLYNKTDSINNDKKSGLQHEEKVVKSNLNKFVKSKRPTRNSVNWNSNTELKLGNEMMSDLKVLADNKCVIKWFNPVLNHFQKEAVRSILKGEARPLPYIIFGPPGTGKTITLVEAILQIYTLIPFSRLLIGTPSNSAADLLCERLLGAELLQPGDLLRLVGFHYSDQDRVPDWLRPYCGSPDFKARDDKAQTRRDGVVNMGRNAIGRHRITVGTCNSLGVLYQMGFPRGHFTHVVVDEAGQATEPEILIPLVFLHSSFGQSVFAGDPLQLGPVVLSSYSKHFGLGESLLSRLLQRSPYFRDPVGFPDTGGYNPHLITRLVYNYRSLPEILSLPNQLFYDGDLISQVSEEKSEEAKILASLKADLPARPNSNPPALVFHGVRGTNCQATDSPSWHNPHEAVQAAIYLQAFYSVGLTPDQCGIITPYQAQVYKIRHLLKKLDAPVPKVGSVEEFQGQERMAMILSTVRSSPRLIESDLRHSVGFVASPQRLNVAITRARAVLVIIGNPHLLARDQYWRSVLTYCVSRGTYTGCDRPPLDS